jgi:hypothetical protein
MEFLMQLKRDKTHSSIIFHLLFLSIFAFVFIFSALASSPSYGKEENVWKLSFGAGPSLTRVNSLDTHHKLLLGTTLNSMVSYRFTDWEMGFTSYAIFTKEQHMTLRFLSTQMDGYGRAQTVSFGPRVRYFVPSSVFDIKNTLGVYASVAALIGLKSLKFSSYNIRSGSEFAPNEKLTNDSHGSSLAIGLYTLKTYPLTQHRHFFLELNYSFLRGRKISVVGGTKTAVTTLFTDDEGTQLSQHTLSLIFGGTVF